MSRTFACSPAHSGITESGSYYLPTNLSGEAGKSCIEIEASGVSIDLMGYGLIGVSGSLDGLRVVGSRVDISVENGSVRSFGGDGLDLASATGARVRVLNARLNGGIGILMGRNSFLDDCLAETNGLEGIRAGDGANLQRCVATSNGREGIEVDDQAIVRSCLANNNSQDGFDVGLASFVEGSISRSNQSEGFFVGDRSVIESCSSAENSRSGYLVRGGTIRGCTSDGNGINGFTVEGIVLAERNLASRNANVGVFLSSSARGSRVDGNHAAQNDEGFRVSSQSGGTMMARNSLSQNALPFSFSNDFFFGSVTTDDAQATTWSNAQVGP